MTWCPLEDNSEKTDPSPTEFGERLLWYSWAVKDNLLFDELKSANLNYLGVITTGVYGEKAQLPNNKISAFIWKYISTYQL